MSIYNGINLTTMIGSSAPKPIGLNMTDAIESLEVTNSDQGHSAFQLTFQAGRTTAGELKDYNLISDLQPQDKARIFLIITIGGIPKVLFDGFVQHVQFDPGSGPGTSKYVVTGDSVSAMMDKEGKPKAHPQQSESTIARTVMAEYASLGIIPTIIEPSYKNVPMKTDIVPYQYSSDYKYLNQLGERFGYTFYVYPGPAPGTNIGYWGPKVQEGELQRALSVNLGGDTNVDQINFTYSQEAATTVEGHMMEIDSKQVSKISADSTSLPALSKGDALQKQTKDTIRKSLPDVHGQVAGLSLGAAQARAKGLVDGSIANVLKASGTLDTVRYGAVLETRKLVGLRGIGDTYDGKYYVSAVTHSIKKGEYKQQFQLTRIGVGTNTGQVIP